jgi:putative acetyltransferase
VAVRPASQRRGIGAALIQRGLAQCNERGAPFVVVLGDPHYYRRFGFIRATEFGIGNEYGVGEEFMIIELQPGAIPHNGVACYCDDFGLVR